MPHSTVFANREHSTQIRLRFQRMPQPERTQFIDILRQLASLDQQLADLHLFLPVIDVRFYGLGKDMLDSASLTADTLLELIQTEE